MDSTNEVRISDEQESKKAVETLVTQVSSPVEEPRGRGRFDTAKTWFGYVKTKQFWIVLIFG
jgi:hypothetical protein